MAYGYGHVLTIYSFICNALQWQQRTMVVQLGACIARNAAQIAQYAA
jgi:hypothetical protein